MDQWNAWQTKYRDLTSQIDELDLALRLKYGQAHWATATERHRLESLRGRRSRVADKILTFLEKNSQRYWNTGVPCHWICGELTFEDAMRPKAEPLSVIPPVAYGGTLSEVRRFAGR